MQMMVPGCEECLGLNLDIYMAEGDDNPDYAYELEFELATHNETHSEADNERRISWTRGFKLAGVLA